MSGKFTLSFLLLLFSGSVLCGQELKPYHKNVIKFNPTPMIWSTHNVTLSYERYLWKNQTACITLGYLALPKLFPDNIGNILALSGRQKYGVNVCLEYRFYLSKRNARPTPDGVYIAPYASYYGYHFKNDFNIINSSADSAGMIKGTYYIFNLGVELGYQFVFWKRLTLDFVLIGPAVSYYGGSTIISGNINRAEMQEVYQEIYEKLQSQFPPMNNLFVSHDFQNSGQLSLFSVGFRYLVQVGFHF